MGKDTICENISDIFRYLLSNKHIFCKITFSQNHDAHLDFDAAIALNPSNPKFYHSKGLAYQDVGDFENAIVFFKEALVIQEDHVPSIYHLGLMQHKNGDLTDALESFTGVLKAIGNDRLVYESRGLVY